MTNVKPPKISAATYQAILTFVEGQDEPVSVSQIAIGTNVDESVIRRAIGPLYKNSDYYFFKANENGNLFARYCCIKRKDGIELDVVALLFSNRAAEALAKHKVLSSRH